METKIGDSFLMQFLGAELEFTVVDLSEGVVELTSGKIIIYRDVIELNKFN